MKRQLIKWEKIFGNISDKGLKSKTHKEFLPCNSKKQAKDLDLKIGKGLKHFSKHKRNSQNIHEKMFNSPLVKEIQNISTFLYLFIKYLFSSYIFHHFPAILKCYQLFIFEIFKSDIFPRPYEDG